MSLPGGHSHTLWGPVVTDPQDSKWLGADRPKNTTGKSLAFYHELTWILDSFVPSAPGRQQINIITDSEYCVRLFADNFIKPSCSKKII